MQSFIQQLEARLSFPKKITINLPTGFIILENRFPNILKQFLPNYPLFSKTINSNVKPLYANKIILQESWRY
jgi:hypothetical protein